MEHARTLKGTNGSKKKNVQEPLDPKRAKAERLKAELDDVLDEIDSVLEENAEEFVKNFVQHGGE